MQYVGESEEDLRSNAMLKLYDRILKEFGPCIIGKACFRADTLVNKIPNYWSSDQMISVNQFKLTYFPYFKAKRYS